MLSRRHDPIVAVATAPGRGAVGIVRVSGRGVASLAEALLGRVPAPRQAAYTAFIDAHGQPLDQGLALFFPAPASATGEDVLELHAHGGPVLLQSLVQRCLEAAHSVDPSTGRARLPGLRPAEPGEFTERAYLNGKLDLAQAEAVADLIDASTQAAARGAARSLSGAFSQAIEGLRDRMIELRMLVEATLDFPEEEIEFLQQARAHERLHELAAQLAQVSAQAQQGALLRDGLRVVIAGQPNAGKSSLLNLLAGAEVAIVTPIAGTTRDRIAQTLQIDGVPLHIVDTAGLRKPHETQDEVERIGIQRSWEAIRSADVVLFMHDLTRRGDTDHDHAEAEIAASLPLGVPVLHVHNKCDAAPQAAQHAAATDARAVILSAKTGAGLERLRHRLLEAAGVQPAAEGTFTARARHVAALRDAAAHLSRALAHAQEGATTLDLLAEDLRLAHDALGRITGAFTPDDLLGEIFGRFCIGK